MPPLTKIQLKQELETRFDQLIQQKNAATLLEVPKHVINNYRSRGATFASKLELLFNQDQLRLKDDWDD